MKYDTALLQKIIELAEKGFTNKEICKRVKINEATFYEWQQSKPEFSESLKKVKQVVDDTVEAKLYKRAMGYKYKETTRELNDKTKKLETTKIVTKEQPPDVTAQIFWLKNRQPHKWRDKTFFEQEGEISHRIKLPKEIEDSLLDNLKQYER